MQRIKHSKYRNTGLLFELLTRQVTVDVLNEVKDSAALRLMGYFAGDGDLARELALYQALVEERCASKDRAGALVDAVVEKHKSLDHGVLKEQKYALVGEIKEAYPFEEFFQTRVGVQDYRLLASIYKLFESARPGTDYRPQDAVDCRYTILESLTGEGRPSPKRERDRAPAARGDRAVRAYAQQLMVERFNERYGVLSPEQRLLLRRYVNNMSNTNGLREYVNEEVDRLRDVVSKAVADAPDEIARLKTEEALRFLPDLKKGHYVSDDQVTSLMMFYELANRLQAVTSSSLTTPSIVASGG